MATLDKRFESYHRRNPHIYEQLKIMSLRLKNVGVEKYGMKALFEILRFNALLTVDHNFRLSNNFTALYARLLMEQEPELEGFFRIRARRTV